MPPNDSSARGKSPDFRLPSQHGPNTLEDEEHVLVLEFSDCVRKTNNSKQSERHSFSRPPSLSPTALKKFIENRNERFEKAIDELLFAIPSGESPVELVQAAAREHIPILPSILRTRQRGSTEILIPDLNKRPPISQVLREITGQQSNNYDEEDINEFTGLDWYQGQIVFREIVAGSTGVTAVTPDLRIQGKLDTPLSTVIVNALASARNITGLYSHQAAAINAIDRSSNVIVSTRTASGKSIIYQALAQDQRLALEQLLSNCNGLEHVRVGTYDGDTPDDQRRFLRGNASAILTNFDMLHASILPHEELWRRLFQNLKIVVVDELHYYTGLLGSHVAMILRRLQRICAAVGNPNVIFVSCSATISNPLEFTQTIFGIQNFEVITEDGAPAGEKEFLVWKPGLVDPLDPRSLREPPMAEAILLMIYLMKRGVRTIIFCKIRRICELVMKTLRTTLTSEGRLDILERVMSYRGGQTVVKSKKKHSPETYSGLFATNALELGVDIGVLDAVIMLGFPRGDLASFRQQAGRAGRRSQDSLVVLVAESTGVDEHYVKNPEELLSTPTPDLLIDLDNQGVLEGHLQCAAHEMPLSFRDEVYFGPAMKVICEKQLSKDEEGWYHTHARFLPYPAKYVSIRGVEEERYAVIDITGIDSGKEPRTLEEIELSRAIFEIYEGAIFLHQGLPFLVHEVSHDAKTAHLLRTDVGWVTRPRDIDPKRTFRVREIRDAPQRAFYGRLNSFLNSGKKVLDAVDLDTPPYKRETFGLWIDIPRGIPHTMRTKGLNPAEGIHSAQHAFLNKFSLGAELRTECKAAEKEYADTLSSRKRPARLIFYDNAGKQSGSLSAKAFDHSSDLLHSVLDTVENCPCEDGCPNCISSSDCKENDEVASKRGAIVILRSILGLTLELDDLPDVDPHTIPETVVDAEPLSIPRNETNS
ncbi:hypothetical protein Clacol_006219 [Clathrus columnatus]|uniref:Helicase C-terminal domain-containing protein n=1 Tax=Clathrus columnatus TaxID=1419009 RepID=A0AAV5AG93_9AGAM|nr:hypothetical protein Clacol_006219 [Clathrus columnatus]